MWHSKCVESPKLNYYVLYKGNYNVEKYIMAIDIGKFRTCMANFRSSVHCLMIERGRHFNIERDYRHCPYCETVIEDEYHLFLICPLYSDLRLKYLSNYYIMQPSVEKFCDLMSSDNVKVIRNISMYLFYALKHRNEFLEVFN